MKKMRPIILATSMALLGGCATKTDRTKEN